MNVLVLGGVRVALMRRANAAKAARWAEARDREGAWLTAMT